MNVTAESYSGEPVRYPQLTVIDIKAEAASVTDGYSNKVLNAVNASCLRLAVFEGEYRWHCHPTSDELFIVVEGCLVIDLQDGTELRLGPWDSVTIPANTVHRTRAIGRTVNVCFEQAQAETVFLPQSQ